MPAVQRLHEMACFVLEKVPSWHGVALVDPGGQYDPSGQREQSDDWMLDVAVEYVPPGHSTGRREPSGQ